MTRSSFGVPLSSIPNTSFRNVTEPVSSAGGFTGSANTSSSTSKMAAIDPFSAVLGIGSIATSIGGLFGQQSAAEKQAEAVEDAAEAQAKAVKQASKTGAELQLAEFGLNFLKDRYEGGAGGALDRVNAARDLVQRANIEANNPSYMALRSIARYEDRLKNAMPGYTPPSALFS